MKKILTVMKKSLKDVSLIDKILMLYMVILLAYTAVHLIVSGTMQESTTVDTIIRTSASAIFGYFISNNFIKSSSDISKAESEYKNEKNTDEDLNICCSRLQIIVVSGIGLISLMLLLISRNFTRVTPEFSATVSQLRDFLSACIGFLVSCGKAK